ncbi:hypothetical protein A3A68_01740 [Candidatus Saccharibacteria bacterium RIFCSPLOWO2_01_FULL_48_13]|nr:MAG: hypothetical protein A2884_01805 [Candidatus Saccharibacteria bacterium RIFCSPHIGHO2_01_FULL_48_12]OGL37469.1 MAG: hypothetical protein A3A68_01740 [Candidatus Saccharibacteria bacterium RIFCSPLOWO2_01_FULL_48_13]
MTTTGTGQQAEAAVAAYLTTLGYKIVDKNWRTKVCEIDLIAKKQQVIYFIEVKFRSSATQGAGWEYIGPQKLKKLKFAASVWAHDHNYNGDYSILAAEVSGAGQGAINIVEIVD